MHQKRIAIPPRISSILITYTSAHPIRDQHLPRRVTGISAEMFGQIVGPPGRRLPYGNEEKTTQWKSLPFAKPKGYSDVASIHKAIRLKNPFPNMHVSPSQCLKIEVDDRWDIGGDPIINYSNAYGNFKSYEIICKIPDYCLEGFVKGFLLSKFHLHGETPLRRALMVKKIITNILRRLPSLTLRKSESRLTGDISEEGYDADSELGQLSHAWQKREDLLPAFDRFLDSHYVSLLKDLFKAGAVKCCKNLDCGLIFQPKEFDTSSQWKKRMYHDSQCEGRARRLRYYYKGKKEKRTTPLKQQLAKISKDAILTVSGTKYKAPSILAGTKMFSKKQCDQLLLRRGSIKTLAFRLPSAQA